MNKGLLKFLSLAFALAMCFGAVACNSCNKTTEGRVEPNQAVFTDGTHNYTAPETQKDFIYNGTCDYTVVVPEITTNYLRIAQSEFSYLFKKATGIDLKVINDSQLPVKTHKEGTKYISLGETTLLKSTDIDYSVATLHNDGGRIVTKDDNIYIVGGYDSGTMFAVYTFMRITFNYECYTSTTIVIDENVKDMKLKAYNVIDIPDFYGRSRGLGVANTIINWDTYDETNFIYRMGYHNTYNQNSFRMHAVIDDPDNPGQMTVDPNTAAVSTTTDYILNREKLMGTHPEWFSTRGAQWCYTARGNAEEFEKMTDAVTLCVTYALTTYTPEEYPLRSVCSITHADNTDFCGCEACSEMNNKYGGARSAAVIRFLNVVSDKVTAWMNRAENLQYKRDDLRIEFFAYGPTMDPPAQKNSEGKYEPIDDSVVLRPNLCIYHANINADYQQSIYAEDNDWVRDKIEGWQSLTDNFSWFLYNTNRRGFQYFYDSFDHYTSEGFQYYATVSREHMYVESQTQNAMPSVWHNLKFYLVSRLSWDCTLDVNKLMENFFNAVYGPGAKPMREFFDAERAYCEIEYKEKSMASYWSIYNYVNTQCNWPINVLDSWLAKCDAALKAVEVYKYADAAKYDMYCRNIEIEAISPLYIMLDRNMNSLSTSKRQSYINRLKADCERWDFSKMIVSHVAYGTDTYLPDYVESLS